ncbi:hypothetical protein BC937DRAFT_92484 [Endogone sp. FLAS-F59071]|nr:hypothetical protein BC937DRAFT_92484 [Endogone sp. FLAS-F59071]|eukprot:RUS21490.1 hypothetical protein BC937DRAFT_92484 [Endogone sp. FLAS-F59071]
MTFSNDVARRVTLAPTCIAPVSLATGSLMEACRYLRRGRPQLPEPERLKRGFLPLRCRPERSSPFSCRTGVLLSRRPTDDEGT